MTTAKTPVCFRCVHYRGGLKCAAFPSAIPVPIVDGRDDHTTPYKGDKGRRFERAGPKARR